MKVYLVRHGQSTYNAAGLCNSDPSIPVHLTDLGRKQVTELAEQLKYADFEQMYGSQLLRTEETAEIIDRLHGVTLTIDRRLNDNDSGFEGRLDSEGLKAWEAVKDPWTARFNGGESIQDVITRVSDFINDLRQEPYQSVMVVTSAVIIQAFYKILNDLSYEEAWKLPVDNASCIEMRV